VLALLASLLVTAAPPAGGKVTVVVLYFDNNSAQREYDVLQKGLADMMVTDLAAVPSLQLVEREKLQKLVDELKLQKTSYFDPKTAQKMGQGLGAQFAVTGAITAIAPEMRIDIRLIEVATARVVFTEKVTGASTAFFDLQQDLVDRFVAGLNVKLAASQRAKSGAIDLGNLVT
jgi:TolB-like protein